MTCERKRRQWQSDRSDVASGAVDHYSPDTLRWTVCYDKAVLMRSSQQFAENRCQRYDGGDDSQARNSALQGQATHSKHGQA